MKRSIFLAAILTVALTWSVASALDFSADVVTKAGGQVITGKTFVSKDKVRMEMMGNITITRMDKKVAWMIMPRQKVYMEQPFDPERVAGAMEKMPGEIERRSLGPDTIDGKSVTKYRITYTADGRKAVILQWIDESSGIPLRTASEDERWSMEYKNLRIGAPDESLFEVPAGYNKFAMPNMNEIMQAAKRAAE